MYNEAYGPDIGVALIILSIHEAYGHDIGVALIIHCTLYFITKS